MSYVSEGDGTWDAKKIPNAHSVSTCSSLLKITLICNKWVNVKFTIFISRSQKAKTLHTYVTLGQPIMYVPKGQTIL